MVSAVSDKRLAKTCNLYHSTVHLWEGFVEILRAILVGVVVGVSGPVDFGIAAPGEHCPPIAVNCTAEQAQRKAQYGRAERQQTVTEAPQTKTAADGAGTARTVHPSEYLLNEKLAHTWYMMLHDTIIQQHYDKSTTTAHQDSAHPSYIYADTDNSAVYFIPLVLQRARA